MKPFNLTLALNGKPIVNHLGLPAKIVHYPHNYGNVNVLLIVITQENGTHTTQYYDLQGRSITNKKHCLFMAPSTVSIDMVVIKKPNDNKYYVATKEIWNKFPTPIIKELTITFELDEEDNK